MRLMGFEIQRPAHETEQARLLDWVAEAHGRARGRLEGLGADAQSQHAARIRRLLDRVGCGPDKIHRRGHVLRDVHVPPRDAEIYDLEAHPAGQGTAARSRVYAREVTRYFHEAYAAVTVPPSDLVHVTCTGYASPSAAQSMVAARGWGELTRVTHAYHMGCYAAFPALRMAAGALSLPRALASPRPARVDIVHTELCSLHFDPSVHTLEQLVVQSLFADGFIRYSLVPDDRGPGLQVLAVDEQLLGGSAGAMAWELGDHGMRMTLSTEVPELLAGSVCAFVLRLLERAGLDARGGMGDVIFAVHPGGPKIIDRISTVLELRDSQVAASRQVLAELGNMSSATLPHVWARLIADPTIAPGTVVVSLAFGPGLTLAGALLRRT